MVPSAATAPSNPAIFLSKVFSYVYPPEQNFYWRGWFRASEKRNSPVLKQELRVLDNSLRLSRVKAGPQLC